MDVRGAERQAAFAGRTLVIVCLVLVLVAGGTVWLVFANAGAARDELLRSYDHLVATQQVLSMFQDAETGRRGFLLSRDPSYLEPYDRAVTAAPDVLDSLGRETVAEDPEQARRVAELRGLADRKLAELAETVRMARAGDFDAAIAVLRAGGGHASMDEIRGALEEMERVDRQRIDELDDASRRASQLGLAGICAVVGLLFVVLIGAGFLLRGAFRAIVRAEVRADAHADQLRVSLDSLSQGISVFDQDCRLSMWNECFAELFDVPGELLHVGTSYDAFIRHDWTDDEGDFLETREQVAAAPPDSIGRSRPVVYERTRKDGRTFELRRTPLPTGGFVITYTDISTRLEMERRLAQAQRMEAIGQLTGGVAHDFNNLLTIIVGNLDMVRTRVVDPTKIRGLELAAGAAERGAKLTRQLLAFAGRQMLEPEAVDVGRMLTDLAEFLQRSLGESVEVAVVPATDVWRVMADLSQLENALFNLALNARDAMPSGGRLTIEAANVLLDRGYTSAHPEVRPGPYVRLVVTDNGVGMPGDVLARAFEPFFTTKPPGKGSGLGLSQVFGFVRQSGGHVDVASEPGHGTTVKLYLPSSAAVPLPATRHPEEIPRGSETVLVVEDDEDVRRTAILMLRDLGYRCLEAAEGKEALDVLRRADPPVEAVFTDVMLPGGLLGRELVERARALAPEIRVLYTSGYTEEVIVHGGRVDEDVVFLAKPYKKRALGLRLRRAIDGPATVAHEAGSEPPPVAAAREEPGPEAPGVDGPARDATAETASPLTAAGGEGPPGEPDRALSILVIEDEPMVLWLALDLLRDMGHEPIEAKNGTEALARLDDSGLAIDAMMVDVQLPDANGVDLVHEARERRSGLPVVVASGWGADSLASLDGMAGIARLAKPYTGETLREALAAVGVQPRAMAGPSGEAARP